MTNTPPAVRILPLNLREFPGCANTKGVQESFFLNELPSREGGCFRYRQRGLDAEPGTAVLFQCEGSVIASAIFNYAKRFERPDKDGYEGGLYFDVKSIKVFDPVNADGLRRIWSGFGGFGQVKQHLDPVRYALFGQHLTGTRTAPRPNAWMTTQWPARTDSEAEHGSIYLPDGREEAGRDIRPGDMVFIYESGTGPTLVETLADRTKRYVPCRRGRQGIVAVATVLTPVTATDSLPEHYVGHEPLWWRWVAETHEEVTTGFVPVADVRRVLGYSAGYKFRGFGELRSGVKRLAHDQADSLLALFLAKQPPILAPSARTHRGHPTPGGGEGPEHEALKNYVAQEPSLALQEPGLRTIKVEYEFPCSDRADVVLADSMNRPWGVEVEVEQDDTELAGLLQAVKYRHMLAVMHGRPFRETRAVLVAYKLSNGIKSLCGKYDVLAAEVDRSAVARWRRSAPA